MRETISDDLEIGLDTAEACRKDIKGIPKYEKGKVSIISMQEFCEEFDDIVNLPISLEEVSRFHTLVLSEKNTPECKLVICTGPVPRIQFAAVFLVGCHLLISGWRKEEVNDAMRPFEDLLTLFGCNGMSCEDFWSALSIAIQHKWISFGETDSLPELNTIDIEEYIHYSRCKHQLLANGTNLFHSQKKQPAANWHWRGRRSN